MEGVIKTARQYFYETGQTQRRNFIARQLSFHGNTVATLGLAYHPTRRAPYASILDTQNFHHVLILCPSCCIRVFELLAVSLKAFEVVWCCRNYFIVPRRAPTTRTSVGARSVKLFTSPLPATQTLFDHET